MAPTFTHTHSTEEVTLATSNPTLSTSQNSLRSAPDYDSSATLSADECPDSSSKHDTGQTTSRPYTGQKRTYEASGLGQGERDPAPAAKSGNMPCVRDIINFAIERNLSGASQHNIAEDLRTRKYGLGYISS